MSEELPQRIPRLGWAIAFIVATGAIAFAFVSLRDARDARRPMQGQTEQFAKAPDFEFLAHDGTKLSSSDLQGKVWVANFIFTRCKGPCPAITSRMAELQQRLGRTNPDDVQLVSISVDPGYDTPAVLSDYAASVGANPERWRFVTGPKAQVEKAIRSGFLQTLIDGKEGEPVHSSRFVVVDREGFMRTYPDGNDPEVVQKLLMDIGDILRERPRK